jgi:hypothetical protein
MPKVGKKDFAYTSQGVKLAQDHAKKTGQKLVMTGNKGGKVRKKLKKGGVKRKHHGGRVSGGMKDKQC